MKKLNKTAEHFRKNEVAALIELSKMYTEIDLCEFAEWLDAWGWKQSIKGMWCQKYFPEIQKTTSQLREIWEVETGRREP